MYWRSVQALDSRQRPAKGHRRGGALHHEQTSRSFGSLVAESLIDEAFSCGPEVTEAQRLRDHLIPLDDVTAEL